MSRTLCVGCSGGDVAAVQDALNQIGANAALPEQQTSLTLLVADGAFGNKTYIRVKDFQAKNGLTQDGIVGPVTLGRLQELLPAVQAGMATSRPAGGTGAAYLPHPSYPAVHDPDPLHLWGGKTSGAGSKTSSSGIKSSGSGSKTY
jgi:peptidoglycan hydrolase-like protein with peptidoglycan-binding domain